MREMGKRRTGLIKESREGNMMKSGHGEKNNRKKKEVVSHSDNYQKKIICIWDVAMSGKDRQRGLRLGREGGTDRHRMISA